MSALVAKDTGGRWLQRALKITFSKMWALLEHDSDGLGEYEADGILNLGTQNSMLLHFINEKI